MLHHSLMYSFGITTGSTARLVHEHAHDNEREQKKTYNKNINRYVQRTWYATTVSMLSHTPYSIHCCIIPSMRQICWCLVLFECETDRKVTSTTIWYSQCIILLYCSVKDESVPLCKISSMSQAIPLLFFLFISILLMLLLLYVFAWSSPFFIVCRHCSAHLFVRCALHK